MLLIYTNYFCTLSTCSNGKVTIPASKVTTIILNDPEVNSKTRCDEGTKKDTEALFIDPISNSGYLIQKVTKETFATNVVISKVRTKINKLYYFIVAVNYRFITSDNVYIYKPILLTLHLIFVV